MDRKAKAAIVAVLALLLVLGVAVGSVLIAPLGMGGGIGGAIGGAAAEDDSRTSAAAACGGTAQQVGLNVGGSKASDAAGSGSASSGSGGATSTPSSGSSSTATTTSAAATSTSKQPTDLTKVSTSGATSTAAATSSSAPAAAAAAMPYALPATHGFTGAEEPVNDQGQVPSTGGAVTWSKFAGLGQPYRDYYITMRWSYAAWNWDGTSTGIDQAQYSWFAAKPRLVLVTNNRTKKSIVAAAIEAGPAPWVGVVSSDLRGLANGPTHGWPNPTKGTPADYKGIVSGFPPVALAALGATTGYAALGQTGDDLVYQWAPDQSVKPGPTGAAAVAVTGNSNGGSACLGVSTGTSCNVTGTYQGLQADQQTNAQAIAGVALQRNLGMDGVVMGEMTAFTESTLHNFSHGDKMGPSSRGLFQQMPSWGPEADRMDPAKSAGFFFDHLAALGDWHSMQPWMAAQKVQGSEFGDGSNYQQNYSLAVDMAKALVGGAPAAASGSSAATTSSSPVSSVAASGGAGASGGALNKWCTTGAGGAAGVVLNGVKVTVPDKPDVPQEIRWKTLSAPNAAIAKGIAAGFGAIGLPYVYGGGGDGGTPPNDGCARGGTAENACQGIIGYDCSGLTAFVLGSAGFSIPAYSQSQRGGISVPRAQALPGDIVVFGVPNGHVAMYLGPINGTPYFLEAPQPGTNVHIRAAYWSNGGTPADDSLYQWWK